MDSPIDIFYNNRKNLFDICGNIINKENYPFINILSTYLVDIVNSIDIEINASTRNSIINWRDKKNPKLLSKFINSDDNINIINRSMHKITSSNYLIIAEDINKTLIQDNFRKLPEYSKFLFDTIIKKCLNDEKFAKDYLNFLIAFNGVIGENISQYINEFISECFAVLQYNSSLKNIDHVTYFSYIKDPLQYMNIGIIYSHIYLINKQMAINDSTNTNTSSKQYNLSESVCYDSFISCLDNINNYLQILPSDMDDLYCRVYFIFGIIETMGENLLEIIKLNDKYLLDDILNLIYNAKFIPNKLKFKILDIQDIIKTFDKNNKNSSKPNSSSSSISISNSSSVYKQSYVETNKSELLNVYKPVVSISVPYRAPVYEPIFKHVQPVVQPIIQPIVQPIIHPIQPIVQPIVQPVVPIVQQSITKPTINQYNLEDNNDYSYSDINTVTNTVTNTVNDNLKKESNILKFSRRNRNNKQYTDNRQPHQNDNRQPHQNDNRQQNDNRNKNYKNRGNNNNNKSDIGIELKIPTKLEPEPKPKSETDDNDGFITIGKKINKNILNANNNSNFNNKQKNNKKQI